MDQNSFYIKGDGSRLPSLSYFCQCHKCNRKIIVTLGLIGVPHNTTPSVICSDCLDQNDLKDYPDLAKRIKDWQSGKGLGPQYLLVRDEVVVNNTLEFTPCPGTITGRIIVDGQDIQNFCVSADGKISFAKIKAHSNYVKSGEYKSHIFLLNWKDEPPPKFTLRVNYEYEV